MRLTSSFLQRGASWVIRAFKSFALGELSDINRRKSNTELSTEHCFTFKEGFWYQLRRLKNYFFYRRIISIDRSMCSARTRLSGFGWPRSESISVSHPLVEIVPVVHSFLQLLGLNTGSFLHFSECSDPVRNDSCSRLFCNKWVLSRKSLKLMFEFRRWKILGFHVFKTFGNGALVNSSFIWWKGEFKSITSCKKNSRRVLL